MTDIRRVQITGGSSFMITLPKSWADSVGLRKNDPISVVPQPNCGLLLTAGAVVPTGSYRKDIDADAALSADALYRELIGAYIAGHSEIAVRSAGSLPGALVKAVTDFTQASIGMEITEEDDTCVVIRDLMDPTEVPPQKNIRREYVLVRRMLADVFAAAGAGDAARLVGMRERDNEVDRIYWLVQRQASIHQMDITLSTQMGLDLRIVTGTVGVSKTVERMGDHAVLMAEHLEELGRMLRAGPVERSIEQVGTEILDLFDIAVKAWLDRDAAVAERCIVAGHATVTKVEALFKATPMSKETASPASLLAGSVRRLAEYCLDLAESAINYAME